MKRIRISIIAVVLSTITIVNSSIIAPAIDVPKEENVSNDVVPDAKYDSFIRASMELLKTKWKKEADKYPDIMPEPMVDIKNTRIVELNDMVQEDDSEANRYEELDGIDCIIEFQILSNYNGNEFMDDTKVDNTVAVYNDGKMEVKHGNVLEAVRAKYFLSDLSDIVEDIIDFGDTYNGSLFPGLETERDFDDELRAESEVSSAVETALRLLKGTWLGIAASDLEMLKNPIVDVRNTRIIKLCKNPEKHNLDDETVEELKTIDYIIEFMLLSNNYSKSYPYDAGIYDNVIVYRDGSMNVRKSNLLREIEGRFYLFDLRGIVDMVIDLGGAYNGNLFFK